MKQSEIDFCTRMAHALAAQFGTNCEIVVHDLTCPDPEHSIVAIEHGDVTGRKLGDGPSHIVLETLHADSSKLQDRLAYLTRTKDGKILKSTTVYIRDENGKVTGIFAINYDVTMMIAMEHTLHSFTTSETGDEEPQPISRNVSDLLDELIEQSIRIVGKPVALMNKEDKVKAVRFLNESGALLITKSGPKICEIFGISKFTLYSYLDEIKNQKTEE